MSSRAFLTNQCDPTDSDGVASCTVCGCTENDPCTGGCHWVPGLPFDICDQCVIRMQRVLVAAAALRRHQHTAGPTNGGLSHHLTTMELKRELDAALGDCGVMS